MSDDSGPDRREFRSDGSMEIRVDRFVCIKPLIARNLPGYAGPQEFRAPRDGVIQRVSADHPAVSRYPDHFAPDDSTAAHEARARGKAGPRPSRTSPRPAAAGTRSASGGGRRSYGLDVPQVRRPRAVVGDGIYDLSTVRASVATPQEEIRELRDRSLRGIERWKFPHGRADADAIRGHLAALIDTDDRTGTLCKRFLIAGSPRHRELFSRAARGQGLMPEEKRAMSLDGPDG
ncbi:MAG TPA: hypothetical protein VFW48_00580, partial [Solirubrobacterales bacterium]|nr:hypothetical protein [Solirubrobacterales bacterium]